MEKLLFCLPTSSFLPNPAPEPSEPAAVEAPEQFEAEKRLFCLLTSNFLQNPAREPAEPTAVQAPEQFKTERLLFCLPTNIFLSNLVPEPFGGEDHACTRTHMRTYGQT